MNFEFRPIDNDTWSDFETLMESRGSPHSCWCTAWIKVEKKNAKAEKSEKKATMRQRVEDGTPVGLLAYAQNEPVGWCAVAPRETYKPLGGDKTKERVWSVVCFFIKREFREQGVSRRLLNEATEYATAQGAATIEGYPVDKDSPSYRFMGFKPTFEKAGFATAGKAGTRRNVMTKNLG